MPEICRQNPQHAEKDTEKKSSVVPADLNGSHFAAVEISLRAGKWGNIPATGQFALQISTFRVAKYQ
jgi:hypothetical protein